MKTAARPVQGALLAASLGRLTVAAQSFPSMVNKLPYDTVKGFEPVVPAHVVPLMLVVNNVPAKSVKELAAYGKANPGNLSFASSGAGGTPDVSKRLGDAGIEVGGGSAQQFGAFIQSEMVKWGKVAKDAEIQPE